MSAAKATKVRPLTKADVEAAYDDGHAEGYTQGVLDGRREAEDDNTPVAVVLRRWHDENHRWAFQFCDVEPCRLVRGLL